MRTRTQSQQPQDNQTAQSYLATVAPGTSVYIAPGPIPYGVQAYGLLPGTKAYVIGRLPGGTVLLQVGETELAIPAPIARQIPILLTPAKQEKSR